MRRPDQRFDLVIAVLAGAMIALLVGAGGALMLRAAERKALPELTETIRNGGDAVGQAVAGQIAKALDYGIPLDGLVGVDSYFAGIVAGVPTVEALALVDLDNKPLFATAADVTGLTFPVISGGTQQATVILSPTPPYFGRAVERLRVALAVASLLTGLIGAAVMFLVLRRQISAGRKRLRTLMRRVADGGFPTVPSVSGRGAVVDALNAYEACASPLKASLNRLEDDVAVVRAIDFDGSLAAGLGPVLEPVARLRSPHGASARTAVPASGRQFASWLMAATLGLCGMVVPFVANFAVDRQWVHASPAWWPSLPWICQIAAALLAYAFAVRVSVRLRSSAALAGLLVAGVAVAGVFRTHDYGTFLTLVVLSGVGMGVAAAALSAGRGAFHRDTTLTLAVILAGLLVGPLLGGLLGEAVGRRMTFLATGALLMTAGLVSLTVRWNTGASAKRGAGALAGWTGGVVAAGVAVGALSFVWIPVSVGYDDYLMGSLSIAAAGAGLAVGRVLPARSAAVLAPLALGALSLAPPITAYGQSGLLAGAASLLTGIGAGALLRAGLEDDRRIVLPLGVGLALGAASVSVATLLAMPPASVAAAIVALLIFAVWIVPGRYALAPNRG